MRAFIANIFQARFSRLAVSCLLAALSALSTVAIADSNSTDAQSHTAQKIKVGLTKLTLTDKSFVKKAALAGETEIALSKLAIGKSTDPDTQAFANQMIKDHTAAAQQLQSIAQSKNISVPTGLDKSHQATLIKIGKLTGADFDIEYNRQMQKDHDAAVTLFSAAASDEILDPQLREFAEKTLPILREHQQEAHSQKKNAAVSSSH